MTKIELISLLFLAGTTTIFNCAAAARHEDVECDQLESDELKLYVDQGFCEQRQDEQKDNNGGKKKKPNAFKAGAKKIMLKFIFLGKKRTFTTELDEHYRRVDMAEGVFVEFSCPGISMENRPNVSWWFNGERIEEYFLDWRVQVSTEGRLLISPVLPADTGNYECFHNQQHRGILFLNVESLKTALLDGYINFLTVAAISLFFMLIIGVYRVCAIACASKDEKIEKSDDIEEQ